MIFFVRIDADFFQFQFGRFALVVVHRARRARIEIELDRRLQPRIQTHVEASAVRIGGGVSRGFTFDEKLLVQVVARLVGQTEILRVVAGRRLPHRETAEIRLVVAVFELGTVVVGLSRVLLRSGHEVVLVVSGDLHRRVLFDVLVRLGQRLVQVLEEGFLFPGPERGQNREVHRQSCGIHHWKHRLRGSRAQEILQGGARPHRNHLVLGMVEAAEHRGRPHLPQCLLVDGALRREVPQRAAGVAHYRQTGRLQLVQQHLQTIVPPQHLPVVVPHGDLARDVPQDPAGVFDDRQRLRRSLVRQHVHQEAERPLHRTDFGLVFGAVRRQIPQRRQNGLERVLLVVHHRRLHQTGDAAHLAQNLLAGRVGPPRQVAQDAGGHLRSSFG